MSRSPTLPRFYAFRPVRVVPCDCPGGPCDFEHVEAAGPPEYSVDGKVVTEAGFLAAVERAVGRRRGGDLSPPGNAG